MSSIDDQEFMDAMAMAENATDLHVVEALEKLAIREKSILESLEPGSEDREVLLYNMTILSAAAARIRYLDKIKKMSEEA